MIICACPRCGEHNELHAGSLDENTFTVDGFQCQKCRSVIRYPSDYIAFTKQTILRMDYEITAYEGQWQQGAAYWNIVLDKLLKIIPHDEELKVYAEAVRMAKRKKISIKYMEIRLGSMTI